MRYALMPTFPDRFWSHVDKSAGPDGCWPWTAGVDRDGYGRSSGMASHRRAYVLAIGPIPDGLTIDHLCFNRACQNPRHLRTLTVAENCSHRQPFHRNGVPRTSCRRGHPYDEANTYRPPIGQRVCRACNLAATNRYRARHGRPSRKAA